MEHIIIILHSLSILIRTFKTKDLKEDFFPLMLFTLIHKVLKARLKHKEVLFKLEILLCLITHLPMLSMETK
jgi:hypothetical protein